jgi:predicted unusual protein kinase regulating ubiquinone biosynthesis (AarF/ABC1/UbiB family)
VAVPAVDLSRTSHRVLTMEFVEGARPPNFLSASCLMQERGRRAVLADQRLLLQLANGLAALLACRAE